MLDRLASPHDGEILSAAAAANRIITQANLSWSQVLGGAMPRPAEPAATDDFHPIRDPRGRLPTVYPPGPTWAAAVYRLLHQNFGSDQQIAFLSRLVIDHGPLPDDWRPTYPIARAIVCASQRPPHRRQHPPR